MTTAIQESHVKAQKMPIEHYFALRAKTPESGQGQILDIKKNFMSLADVFIDDSFYWTNQSDALKEVEEHKPLLRELYSGRRPVMLLFLGESGTKMVNVLFSKENGFLDKESVLYPISVNYAIFKEVRYALLVPNGARIVSEN